MTSNSNVLVISSERHLASVHCEYVALPLDLRRRCAVDQYGVESTRRLVSQRCQIHLRRRDQARTFGGGDAGRGTALGFGTALAHFDQYERLAVTGDDIDLAQPP